MANAIDERMVFLHLGSCNILCDTNKINKAIHSKNNVFINIHNGKIIKRNKANDWFYLSAMPNDKYAWVKSHYNDNDFFESESYIPIEIGLNMSENNLKLMELTKNECYFTDRK